MGGRKRVLVLDFDCDLLIALERLLEDSGFSTTTTWDVGEAIELLETRYFDFFVVGNRPPELDAKSLINEVRAGGVKCGSFILGGAQNNQDGYSDLLDQIRAFPVLRLFPEAGCRNTPQPCSHLWQESVSMTSSYTPRMFGGIAS